MKGIKDDVKKVKKTLRRGLAHYNKQFLYGDQSCNPFILSKIHGLSL